MKIVFIFNPVAGLGKSDKYCETFKSNMKENWEFISLPTEKGRLKEQVISICKKGVDRIIVSGGDGTIMDVINGIMASGKEPVMGIIPQGTGNDLARALGYYKRFKKKPLEYINGLVRDMEDTEQRFLRVLSVNNGEVYFTNYCGIGFDAKIIREFHEKRSLPIANKMIFLYVIFKNFTYKVHGLAKLSFVLQEGKKNTIFVKGFKNLLLINIPSYAGGLMKPDSADAEKDSFSLIVVKKLFEFFFLSLDGRLPPFIINSIPWSLTPEMYEINEITVTPPTGSYIQIDGEDYTERFNGKKTFVIRAAGRIRIFK